MRLPDKNPLPGLIKRKLVTILRARLEISIVPDSRVIHSKPWEKASMRTNPPFRMHYWAALGTSDLIGALSWICAWKWVHNTLRETQRFIHLLLKHSVLPIVLQYLNLCPVNLLHGDPILQNTYNIKSHMRVNVVFLYAKETKNEVTIHLCHGQRNMCIREIWSSTNARASSTVSSGFPFSSFLMEGKRKKSQGAKSGE